MGVAALKVKQVQKNLKTKNELKTEKIQVV